jgi:hypothetical protein
MSFRDLIAGSKARMAVTAYALAAIVIAISGWGFDLVRRIAIVVVWQLLMLVVFAEIFRVVHGRKETSTGP